MPVTSSERHTQNRVVKLLREVFSSGIAKYEYLGLLKDGEHENIMADVLKKFLKDKQGCTDNEVERVYTELHKSSVCYQAASLYKQNKEVYNTLRYGIKVIDENDPLHKKKTIYPIDWEKPERNVFAIAEEVTVKKSTETEEHRRPDIVIFVNGIAMVVIELKSEVVSVKEAMRQHWRNQLDGEIPGFFSTVQLCMPGNDTEGLYYGTILTPEKYYVKWREDAGKPCPTPTYSIRTLSKMIGDWVVPPLDAPLLQMLEPKTLLWFIKYCIVFDNGVKKVARPNQYFALQAAQERVEKKENGIVWHSQGSGKSLTMVMLAQWIKETQTDARVVIITDRDELDLQITKGFANTGEIPVRATSGSKLIGMLNGNEVSLICTLVHKFGLRSNDKDNNTDDDDIIKHKPLYKMLEELEHQLPKDFHAKGNIFCFIDECHRTQGGSLNKFMKRIMGEDAMLIGFTGTPLLKRDKDKLTSVDNFGGYIHTYTFKEAVKDNVVLDLRYQPFEVRQRLGDKEKMEEMFEMKTQGLNPKAKSVLKNRWATIQNVYSSHDRMRQIAVKILCDMEMETPLEQGYGNAMLIAQNIYSAYKYWKIFDDSELKGKCAVISSYEPNLSLAQGFTGEKRTEEEQKYLYAKEMLGGETVAKFEETAKTKFVNSPGEMKLLIVVDKLLTGFDAPSCTYLYIDRKLEDHNLFQAVCRVNRLDGDRKTFGRIIDFQNLFNLLEEAMNNYSNADLTQGAFCDYAAEDVEGLLNANEETRKLLEKALEKVERLSELVKQPKDTNAFCDYFCFDPAVTPSDKEEEALAATARRREDFYNAVIELTRRYADASMQMIELGFTTSQADDIVDKVKAYDRIRHAIMQRSGDFVDLKRYDAEMRSLLDRFINADGARKIEELDDFSFLDILDSDDEYSQDENQNIGGERGVAETLKANTRRVINRKRETNPAEYERLTDKLNRLIEDLKNKNIEYEEYLKGIKALNEEIRNERKYSDPRLNTPGKKALYDNLGKNIDLTLKVIEVVRTKAQMNWRNNVMRKRMLQMAVSEVLKDSSFDIVTIMNILVKNEEF